MNKQTDLGTVLLAVLTLDAGVGGKKGFPLEL